MSLEEREREQPRMCLGHLSHLTPFLCSTLALHNHLLPQIPPNKTTPGETTPVTLQSRPARSGNVRKCDSEDSRMMVKPSSLTEIKFLHFFLPLFSPSVKPSQWWHEFVADLLFYNTTFKIRIYSSSK